MAEVATLEPLLPSRVVHQFPAPSWIENLAVRSNGQVLVTFISAPEVYLVDPSEPAKTVLIHKFSNVTAMSGIVEVEHDKFYVAGGVCDVKTMTSEVGSYKLWEIDMATFDTSGEATVKEVLKLDKIACPNGLELLSRSEKTILAADCEHGALFKIDIANGTHEIALEVDEMRNPENPFIPVSINGVKVLKDYLYWTNTSKALFCRAKIVENGKSFGSVEVIHQGLIGDDFCFDSDGNAWVTQNPFNTITVAKSAGGLVTAAGRIDLMDVAGATACQFDRRKGKEHLLYVVTNGGLAGPVNGNQVEGGKVSVIDTTAFKTG
ncbi:unnamed protein product [Clonostachys byssicola]|uniref:SMP-30/Gluconolactonase/LRE-like region domain-containing protein n=1 Tax=Clonostachys byssicola TaxID=160290 RepID=A0A9N9UAI6_9HYPO|nr:unnamed protein product [Clonostachys byssicola]